MEILYPLIGFALVHLLAVASPGPTFLVVARTAATGSRAAALVAALAVGIGALVWATAALFGLQALLVRFEWLYLTLRIAGGLYLVYLGIQLVRHAGKGDAVAAVAATSGTPSLARVFREALMVQLSNPKVAVFFGSVFLTLLPAAAPAWMVAAVLAIVFVNECGWFTLVALLFSGNTVRVAYRRARVWIERLTGGVLAALGLRLALDR
ncbi:LysE family transporter [Vineibacter terrae]|uniref:LysE family transporter n=1 Tax=Vineibacter terrae TaxID=2586908 RepID=UPI002E2FFE18|nr:LysE family transporter [Vineibacter terrae]HEX2889038.1 LysE family transporter [Vineibacter terrae]